ncbi:MAG: four helix bundle protein [Bacteroidia bacterium]
MNRQILENRLIDFSVGIVKITKHIDASPAGQYFCNQVLRSGGSPALHYGEAIGAESTRDFIHKLIVALKELRETHNNLRIIHKSELCDNHALLDGLITECNELIAILYTTLKTTKRNQKAS